MESEISILRNVLFYVYYLNACDKGREYLFFCQRMDSQDEIESFIRETFKNNPDMEGGRYYVSILDTMTPKRERFVFCYTLHNGVIYLSPSDIS